MKKKLMAVAVAGALAAPALAFAQTSTVNIYGNITIDVVKLDQGRQSPDTRVSSLDLMSRYDSYLGFRGEEKLGGNLSAWFQCENTMDVTGEDQSGDGPTGLCDRNSGVGLRGGWGNIFVGNWDSPFKINHGGKYRPFSSAGVFGMRSLLHNEQDGTDESAPFQFDRRNVNSVNYHSPSWGGFNVKGQVTTLDTSTNNVSVIGSGVGPLRPRLWAIGAEYDNGPLSIAAAYEQHKDFNPAALATGIGPGLYSGGDDKSWEVAAAYTIAGVFRLSAIYAEIKYDVGNGLDMKGKGYAIYGDWAIGGPHRLRGMWAHARNVSGNSTVPIGSLAAPRTVTGAGVGDTGADLYGIQYAYAFSKRTEVNVGYARLSNDDNSRHRLQSSAARPTSGDRDQDAFQVGIKHRF